MADALRTEQQNFNGGRDARPLSNYELQNLWTRDGMQKLCANPVVSFPRQDQSTSRNLPADVLARGADGFTLCDDSQLMLAANPDAAEKPQLGQLKHEKMIPHDGQSLSIEELLKDYKTSFMDAYEHSKQVAVGIGVAPDPPHSSVRALLTHTALTSGNDTNSP